MAAGQNIHCIGIAGSGMLPLSLYLVRKGHTVTGSDRFLDTGDGTETFELLRSYGIRLFPQDGSGVTDETDEVVFSAAVEQDVPDRVRARELGIPSVPRARKLADIFNESRGIAVAGSSGKSTTGGMTGFILKEAGLSPSMINGAALLNYSDTGEAGDFLVGDSDILCIEADESDGTLTGYRPAAGIVCNISRDHKEIPELKDLFTEFARKSENVVYNSSCPLTSETEIPSMENALSFSTGGEEADFPVAELVHAEDSISFSIHGCEFSIPIPGLYNAANAAAACAAASVCGIPLKTCAEILRSFRGMDRRMNIIGRAAGITVLDDYAHNPAKIAAAIGCARSFGQNIVVLYQPHGYSPTRFVRDELVSVFAHGLTPADTLFITDIFYAGGTAEKNISARDLVRDIESRGIHAFYVPRDLASEKTAQAARTGDAVMIMGARDISLPALARGVLEELSSHKK